MPEAVVQPENMASFGAAIAISSAIEELGPEWEVRLEGPSGMEEEYRSFPLPDLDQISAVVYVTIAVKLTEGALTAIWAGAERWWREKSRGGTIKIIVVEKETGERLHTIRVPEPLKCQGSWGGRPVRSV